MSDAPVVFKRKAKTNQHARVSTPDADTTLASEDGEGPTESPSVLAAKVKKKTQKKAKSTLSFGAEEEGEAETFKLKKGVLSSNISRARSSQGVTASAFEPTIPQQSTGPTYDAAYLSQLKASTPTARPSLPTDSADVEVPMDVDEPCHISSLGDEVDSEQAIPSASSVLAAKQKRERLRANKGGDDYISLSLTKREDYSQGPHPESRLVREEDELGDADDEYAEYTSAQERVALGKKSRKKEALQRRVEMNEMIVDAEEEDEETREWEQEQLRRGGLRAASAELAAKPVYKPTPIPPVTPIPTMPAAIARLTQSMSDLTTSHAQHSAAMAKLGEEQRLLEEREKEMREMITRAEEKRSWFVAFREWVESVATFLDEKYPPLEKLEEEHLSLLKERADMISQRRKAEDEDDLSLFLGTPPSLYPAEDAVDELGRVLPSAASPAARQARYAERQARRARRKARLQQPKRPADEEEEGFSTDASLPPGDAEDFRTAMDRLDADGAALMDDVRAEEFRDPMVGLGRWFGEWRAKFGDVYTGAWGGLGMVGAWEFWVRLEILGWNPLEHPRSFDSFKWYGALYKYSRPASNPSAADDDDEEEVDEDEPALGPDGDLVSAMLSTAVIPRLALILDAGGFDPHSSRAVRRLTDLAEELALSVPLEHAKSELLLKAAHGAFQRALAAAEVTLAPFLAHFHGSGGAGGGMVGFDPAAVPARRRVLARAHALLRNVLRWRRFAGDRFGLGMLATRIAADIMLPVAESGWEVGGEEVMRKVAQELPAELIPDSLRPLRSA